MIAEGVFDAWKGFADTGIKTSESEADYEALLAFMDELTSHYDISEQPWGDLFGLVAGYMHGWELVNEPDLKDVQIPPYRMLAHYMEQQGVSHSICNICCTGSPQESSPKTRVRLRSSD